MLGKGSGISYDLRKRLKGVLVSSFTNMLCESDEVRLSLDISLTFFCFNLVVQRQAWLKVLSVRVRYFKFEGSPTEEKNIAIEKEFEVAGSASQSTSCRRSHLQFTPQSQVRICAHTFRFYIALVNLSIS